ncbi:hypothetical protein P7K49_004375 [Saguinus oedipus]|uniref:Uncharacterized protein n=1 Tax=Saguinus oedipus TaxID=9490 RepID=A0ABQ9W8T0_SAGOE|nr:hypothetical protein P7K49_004375 [Saguinus oedipus]
MDYVVEVHLSRVFGIRLDEGREDRPQVTARSTARPKPVGGHSEVAEVRKAARGVLLGQGRALKTTGSRWAWA